MKRFILCILILCGIPVHASTWTKDTGWELKLSSDGVYQVLPGAPSANKPSGVTCVGGSCTTTSRPVALPKVQPSTNFNPSSAFTKVALAAGLVTRLGPWIALGTAAYQWMNDAGVTYNPNSGALTTDQGGQAPVSGFSYFAEGSQTSRAWGNWSSPSGPAARIKTEVVSTWSASGYNVEFVSDPVYGVNNGCGVGAACFCLIQRSNGTRSCGYGSAWQVSRTALTQTACAYRDSGLLSGVNAIANICPSGTPTAATPAMTAQALVNAQVSDANLGKAWREILDNGGQIDDSGPSSLTGPSQVTGPTSSTTSTTATGTQAVTNTATTYNITYNTNNITINETKTVTNPDGSSTSTTQKPADPCASDPNSLACAKLGDPGSDSPQWQTKTVVYQAENLGFTGSCPSPWTGTVHGWNLSMSWQPACDVAPQIRLGVLALCTLGALLMIVTTVRT